MSRSPIVTKRRLTRVRRRDDFRTRVVPVLVPIILMAESIGRLARYDYAEPKPDAARDAARIASVMERWGRSPS